MYDWLSVSLIDYQRVYCDLGDSRLVFKLIKEQHIYSGFDALIPSCVLVSFGGILVLRMWWVMPSDRVKGKKFRLQHKRKFVWPNLMEIRPQHWWKACVLRVVYIRGHGMPWYHNESWKIVTEFHNSKGRVSHNIYSKI